MSSVQLIPLKALVASPLNARKTDRTAAVEELAASIEAHGLLQGLTVVAMDDGRFQVAAGGRRHAALKLLLKRKVVTPAFEVPCVVVPLEIAEETSLAENVQRVAMHPMDEVEAFARLRADRLDEDAIAARFGVSVRHVRQRLALAGLAPALKAAVKRGEIGLEAARAFCLVPDHDAQERVFALMTKPITNAWSVRAYLTQGSARATDRLAVFVGLEAYEAAGGIVRRDLFEDGLTFLESPELLARLAAERLEALKAPLEAEGWGWVRVNFGHGSVDGASGDRLRPDRRPFTAEETAAMEALETKWSEARRRLDADLDDADAKRDLMGVTEAMKALAASAEVWDAEKMKLAGCVISIDGEGRPSTATGIILASDRRRIAAIDKRRAAEAAREQEARRKAKADAEAKARAEAEAVAADVETVVGESGGGMPDDGDVADVSETPVERPAHDDAEPIEEPSAFDPSDDDPPFDVTGYTQKTTLDLTSARTRAIRAGVAADVDLALALAVFALGVHHVAREGAAGLSIHAFARSGFDDVDELVEGLNALRAVASTEVGWFDWCLRQGVETLLPTLALLVASGIDLSHSGANETATRLQARADRLAGALGLDMTRWWKPDAAFFMGLTKKQMVEPDVGGRGARRSKPPYKDDRAACRRSAVVAVAPENRLAGLGARGR